MFLTQAYVRVDLRGSGAIDENVVLAIDGHGAVGIAGRRRHTAKHDFGRTKAVHASDKLARNVVHEVERLVGHDGSRVGAPVRLAHEPLDVSPTGDEV